MTAPLSDIRVVDFSRVLAGPFCTMMLGDFGADVLKIERPGGGDDTRHFGPPFMGTESAYYLAFNRSKRSLALDLACEKGRAIARELCRRADVVVENFRPRVMRKLGLDYPTLSADNPRLVYASISGFGHDTAPGWADRPAYDLVLQGLGGIPSLTGDPDGPPFKVGTSMADLVAGMYAFSGILLGLRARERDGTGQHVDISLLDGQIAMLSYHAVGALAEVAAPYRMGNAHPNLVPYETFACADGWLNVACATDRQFQNMCAALGLEALASDPELATNRGRVARRADVRSAVADALVGYTVERATRLANEAGFPAGPVLGVTDALGLPPVRARGMVVKQRHPQLGDLSVPGNPIRLDRTPPDPSRAAPCLGEDNQGALGDWLGMDAETIQALRETGVIT